MRVPVVLITGPVGVGKTSVAFELLEVLEERNLAHAFFDVDGLTYFHPKPADDRFGERFALDALGLLYPRLREQGIERLILARVLWERDSLARYAEAIPGAELVVEDEGKSPIAWQGSQLSKIIAVCPSGRCRAR